MLVRPHTPASPRRSILREMTAVVLCQALVLLQMFTTSAFVVPNTWSRTSSTKSSQNRVRASWQRPAFQGSGGDYGSDMVLSEDAHATAEGKAARLLRKAALFRAEAAALEEEKARHRREGADRSFKTFDVNNNGLVGVSELQAGLDGPLRKDLIKQLAIRMGRKPSAAEIDARVADLPGGCLLPDDLARRLIDIYDKDGDGLLQQSEFAPVEELQARLGSMFQQRREEELEIQRQERMRELEEKRKAKGGAVAQIGVGSNETPATTRDKWICALAYLLPLSDGIIYARHVFEIFPGQLAWAEPLAVFMIYFRNLPFATLALFFGLSLLAGNQQVNKLVRFNMLQAINFDIALIVPSLLGPLAKWSLGPDAYKLAPITDVLSDVLFVALLAAVAYSIVCSATGIFPNKLPLFGGLNRENPDKMN